jgi:hypothetical protein
LDRFATYFNLKINLRDVYTDGKLKTEIGCTYNPISKTSHSYSIDNVFIQWSKQGEKERELCVFTALSSKRGD